jgi:hypothetical protein
MHVGQLTRQWLELKTDVGGCGRSLTLAENEKLKTNRRRSADQWGIQP